MRISPTYGCAMGASQFCDREDALQRDAEVEREERLHVEMRLASPVVGERARAHRGEAGRVAVGLRKRTGQEVAGGDGDIRVVRLRRRACRVHVRGQLANRQRVRLLPAALPQRVPASPMDRHATPKIGQREIHPSVAAVGRPQQREQRLVLVDRQQLAVAQRPALRREPEGHDPDFRQERFCHLDSPCSFDGPGVPTAPISRSQGVMPQLPAATPLMGPDATALSGPTDAAAGFCPMRKFRTVGSVWLPSASPSRLNTPVFACRICRP